MTNASTTISNCFTSDFTNYRVNINFTATSANQAVFIQFTSGGTPDGSLNYKYAFQTTTAGGAASSLASNGNGGVVLGFTGTASPNASSVIEIFQPQVNGRTYGSQQRYEYDSATFNSRQGSFVLDKIASYDGIALVTGGSNITAEITVFGYRK
jgi:hypothetical protein